MRFVSSTLMVALGGLVLAGSPPAAAERVIDNAAPFALNARLNFQLVYPQFLRFRVGTTGATVNLLQFDVPAMQVGSGATVSATSGGDAGPSAVNVEVVGNNGQVTITPTNSGAGNGIGTGTASDGFINYNQISTVSSSPQLPAPVLSNAGGTTAQPTLSAGPVTQRTAVWTYGYLNQTIPSAGTYGGAAAALGGQVTYTASMP